VTDIHLHLHEIHRQRRDTETQVKDRCEKEIYKLWNKQKH